MEYWRRHGPPDGYVIESRGNDQRLVEISG